MVQEVKSKRRYHSPRREEQAAATRRAILEAAERLFERNGFAATSMAEIAAEAEVATKTVYLGFETKSGLLRALWNFRLRGDEGREPVAQRGWYVKVLEESDPELKLRLNARNGRDVKSRVGGLFEVIQGGSHVDAEVASLWSRIESDFYENQAAVVRSLNPASLRPGLDQMRATDILWTLNHPSVYTLLVRVRGWSLDEFERWLGDTFCAQLLASASDSGGRTRS